MLPIAYVGWFLLNNSERFLGSDLPRGRLRFFCNAAMIAALLVTFISVGFTLIKIGKPLKDLFARLLP